MIKIDQLQAARNMPQRLKTRVVDRSVAAYFGNLGDAAFPSPDDLTAAASALRSSLVTELLSDEFLSGLGVTTLPLPDERAALELSLDELAPGPQIPSPQSLPELSPQRIGLAAAVGALAGMTLLAPFTHLVFGARDVGLLIGPPLGALLLVLAVWHASKSKWLKGLLLSLVGVAALAEIWQLMGGGLFTGLWGRLRGRGSAFKRVLLYLAIVFVVVIAKCRPNYDRPGYEDTVRAAVSQWLEMAIVLIILRCAEPHTREPSDLGPAIAELGEQVQSLHRASQENLAVAAEELIQAARNQGFENLEGPPQFLRADKPQVTVFLWTKEHDDKYETFGHIEPGDEVIAYAEPVVLDGVVRKKGLVRKKRKGK